MKSQMQKDRSEEIIKRLRAELLREHLKITALKIESIDDEDMSTIERVKEYMEETTEKTDKKTNIIGTTELWERYIDWNREYNTKNCIEGTPKYKLNTINGVETTNVMGKHLTLLGYVQYQGKVEGKQTRGYGYLKYTEKNDKSINVLKFMEKYTEKTNSLKDRLVISKLLPKFYDENRERYGVETFSKKLNKYGYQTKGAKELQKTEGRYGREKVIKVGEAVPCVLKVILKGVPYDESPYEA